MHFLQDFRSVLWISLSCSIPSGLHKSMRSTEPSFASVTTEKNVHTTLGSPVEEFIVFSIQNPLLSLYWNKKPLRKSLIFGQMLKNYSKGEPSCIYIFLGEDFYTLAPSYRKTDPSWLAMKKWGYELKFSYTSFSSAITICAFSRNDFLSLDS